MKYAHEDWRDEVAAQYKGRNYAWLFGAAIPLLEALASGKPDAISQAQAKAYLEAIAKGK